MTCPTFPEMDLAEWGMALREKLNGQRYPLFGTYELTERCNLGCAHCFINQPAASKTARDRELTTDQALQLLDKVAAAGCLFLTLTGGEILLRDDFNEIYTYAIRKGFLISLFTNGTMLTPDIADLLADLRPQLIDITLYGATPETYEKMTHVPGAYARCRRGIDLLLERGLPVFLKTTLTTINQHELPAFQALADQLGVNFRYDNLLWPRLDGRTQSLQYQLSTEEIIALDAQDPERMQELAKVAESFSGKRVRAEYLYSCGAGLQSFHIDSAGQMSICIMSRHPAYDLKTLSFKEAWERIGELRQVKRQMDTPCLTCTLGGLCAQCPGWSQAIHGDDETPVDFVCKLAHQRVAQVQHIIID
jgi:radical SAM protein with 4Fe4S-binding SPASM domain